jgi:hypothetical protein
MPFDRFLIAPINTGLETDLKPWLIPDDAFAQLNNAYVFRGRVRKRFGSQYTGVGWPDELTRPLYSRLGYNLGVTYSGTIPGSKFSQLGQQFWVNGVILTVYQNGAMLTTDSAQATGTYNTGTGAYAIAGAGVTGDLYWYPSQPVMGLCQLESSTINDEPSMAFDTQFAYRYNGFWFNSTGGGPWHGDDTNFFWTCNWKGLAPQDDTLFVSNFQVTNLNGIAVANDDPIWYYNIPSQAWTSASGANAFYFAPAYTGTPGAPQTGPFVVTARIIVAFKNRLLLLNTVENDNIITGPAPLGTNSNFPFRCRFSAYDSTVAVNSWYNANQSDTSGNNSIGGGYIDAPTEEEIVSAEFIKDRLIVYFENSTWELVWTSNQVYPFVWQKLNTELGSDATFSIVPFDRSVIAIGGVGVHACNGSNVQRIDEKIPDQIFTLNKEQDSIIRVVGIRDFYTEMIYWTFPNDNATKYPNKVLVYNYRNNTWAFNDDTITFFGYFEQQTDTTWEDLSDLTWEEANFTWDSGVIESNFRQTIAGNQHGYIFTISSDVSSNARVLQITNAVQSGTSITLSIQDHTLTAQDYISLANLQGVTISDGTGNPTIFKVNSVVDANTITIGGMNYPLTLTGAYKGGGVAGRVSNIQVLSKQWNPYIGQGRNFYLARIDFCVEKTTNGEVTVDYFPSGSEQSMLLAGGTGEYGTGANMSTGVLETRPYDPRYYPFESQQSRLWHPVYFNTDGQTVQIGISLSDAQLRNESIATSNFVLEGLVLHVQPTSYRLQ